MPHADETYRSSEGLTRQSPSAYSPNRPISVRLPRDLLTALDQYADERRETRSKVITDLLDERLTRVQTAAPDDDVLS